jgi:hypothetical protein
MASAQGWPAGFLLLDANGWNGALFAIRLAHTVIWAFMVACILALPVAALRGRFRLGAILSAIVLGECGVLALNHRRCPLTDLAARFTPERAANFDIYLPLWLAQYNKLIFGILFALGEIVLLACWVRASVQARKTTPQAQAHVEEGTLAGR